MQLPYWCCFTSFVVLQEKISKTSIASFSYLDPLLEIKSKYFAGEESKSLEPKCGIVSVADGTAKGIGHLIAASVCHGGTVDCDWKKC